MVTSDPSASRSTTADLNTDVASSVTATTEWSGGVSTSKQARQAVCPHAETSTERQAAAVDPTGFDERDRQLARAAHREWGELPAPDLVAGVEAGQLAAAATSASPAHDVGDDEALRISAETGQAAAVVQRQGLAPVATASADWAGFGTVIPVLAASPGAGATVVATVLADALQIAERQVLLVDTADPTRSGLAAAAGSDGPMLAEPHPSVRTRVSWRDRALLARVESDLPVMTPGMVPPPRFFKPAQQAVQATVVDLSHDAWRVGAHPLAGAGAWLRSGSPPPRPVLVCGATCPSVLHAEQVLTRLSAWDSTGVTTPPAQLVVVGAKRWPAGVPGGAGRRVSELLAEAVFLPHIPDFATSGVTAEVTPKRLREAITPLLRRWGLLPQPAFSAGRLLGRSRRTKGAIP